MSELILHHYAMSPFSEKVRAMLGYTGMRWQSVIVAPMPPRALLAPLAGGYRKIPVAQIGADVFCDSRTITREIARLSGKPELALEGCSEEVREFVRRTDLEVFFACVIAAGGPKLLYRFWRQTSLMTVFRFLKDRIELGRTAKVRTASPKKAPGVVREHLTDLEIRLEKRPFLFGDTPNIADFSAYHSLWFIRDVAGSALTAPYPRVNAWLDRIAAFGQGEMSSITPEQALETAKAATPRALPASGDASLVGEAVTIAPSDYGLVPVSGTLVAALPDGWVLSRHTAQTGSVQVHFPREGFAVSAR